MFLLSGGSFLPGSGMVVVFPCLGTLRCCTGLNAETLFFIFWILGIPFSFPKLLPAGAFRKFLLVFLTSGEDDEADIPSRSSIP